MAKITKKAKLIAAKVNAEQKYEVAEAVKLVKEFATAKFDETIEVSFNLNLDPTKAEQQLRGAIVLPHGTGKTSKILVFAEGDAATAATEAGADYVGADEYIQKIQKENWFDFDVVVPVTSPDRVRVTPSCTSPLTVPLMVYILQPLAPHRNIKELINRQVVINLW